MNINQAQNLGGGENLGDPRRRDATPINGSPGDHGVRTIHISKGNNYGNHPRNRIPEKLHGRHYNVNHDNGWRERQNSGWRDTSDGYGRERQNQWRDRQNGGWRERHDSYEADHRHSSPRKGQPPQRMNSHSPIEENPSPEILHDLEEEGVYPLKNKSLKFPLARYFCRLCDYHCDSLVVCWRHIADQRHTRLKETKVLPYILCRLFIANSMLN